VRDAALAPLLEWAEAVVPRAQWAATPLFLFGTAGLRRLPPARQAALLGHVRAALRASSFAFEDGWARVISGADEGAFGWIALNYLAGRLRPGAPRLLPVAPARAPGGAPAAAHVASAAGAAGGRPGGAGAAAGGGGARPPGAGAGAAVDAAAEGWDTLGALDLGGSSLEVTFMPLGRPAALAEGAPRGRALPALPGAADAGAGTAHECAGVRGVLCTNCTKAVVATVPYGPVGLARVTRGGRCSMSVPMVTSVPAVLCLERARGPLSPGFGPVQTSAASRACARGRQRM